MKKAVAIFWVGVLLLFCTACKAEKVFADNVTCEQILNTATAVQSYENSVVYAKGKNDLDSYTMAMWSDGIFAECEEFGLISDYAICYSNDNTTYEISVLKANSKDDVAKLKSLFERRKQTLEAGTKAAYDPNFKKLMQSSKIETSGEFVILLITNDNDAVVNAIDGLKQ